MCFSVPQFVVVCYRSHRSEHICVYCVWERGPKSTFLSSAAGKLLPTCLASMFHGRRLSLAPSQAGFKEGTVGGRWFYTEEGMGRHHRTSSLCGVGFVTSSYPFLQKSWLLPAYLASHSIALPAQSLVLAVSQFASLTCLWDAVFI